MNNFVFCMLFTLFTITHAGPLSCIAILGACAGPCFFSGPAFVPCVSLSCGISGPAVAAACLLPIP